MGMIRCTAFFSQTKQFYLVSFRCHRIVKLTEHAPDRCYVYPETPHRSLLKHNHWLPRLASSAADRSNEHHNYYDVQIPKSFYSDSAISVFSYTSGFVCVFMIQLHYLADIEDTTIALLSIVLRE